MKSLWIAATTIFLGCGSAFAQVGMTTSPSPGLEATSPLVMSPGAPVAQTGIPWAFAQTLFRCRGFSRLLHSSAGA
jgi:hypothetical protein